ncbi:hypothetical protein BKA82DRAFT_4018814 [Pisolithus tinctorius]|nr:hypothetical protein BKA82DRAFT_4018814 [Pisolithus tinctorius]
MSGMSKDQTYALMCGVGGNRHQWEVSHWEKGWEWDHEVVLLEDEHNDLAESNEYCNQVAYPLRNSTLAGRNESMVVTPNAATIMVEGSQQVGIHEAGRWWRGQVTNHVHIPAQRCKSAKCQKPWGYLPEAQNCVWASQKGWEVKWTHRMHAHMRRALGAVSHIGEPERLENRTDAWNACMHSALKSMQKWLQEPKDVRTGQNHPTHSLAQRAGEVDGLGKHVDVSTAWMDVQSNGNNLKTAKNPRTQHSPLELEIEMAKCPEGQKHVNIDGNDMHALRNMLIEAQDMQNIKIAFGEWLR